MGVAAPVLVWNTDLCDYWQAGDCNSSGAIICRYAFIKLHTPVWLG